MDLFLWVVSEHRLVDKTAERLRSSMLTAGLTDMLSPHVSAAAAPICFV